MALAAAAIQDGGSLLDVVTATPHLIRNIHHLAQFEALVRHKKALEIDRSNIEVVWIYGPSGAGKSMLARELAGDRPVYVLAKTGAGHALWWDHYKGEEVVIMDELRADWCAFGQLLRILDRYPVQIGKKGTTDTLCATTFYITCTHPPEKLFSGNATGQRRVDAPDLNADVNDLNQLHRRITKRYFFTSLDGGYEEEPTLYRPPALPRLWKRVKPTTEPQTSAAPPSNAMATDGFVSPFAGGAAGTGGYGGFSL